MTASCPRITSPVPWAPPPGATSLSVRSLGCGADMGTHVWARAAAAILLQLLLGDPTAPEDTGAGETLQVHIICFNFEMVQVTWNNTVPATGTNLTFFYRFQDDQPYAPCTRYLVRCGLTAGCLVEGGDRVLDFCLHNGSRRVLAMQRWVSDYLKPRAPRDLRFLWGQDAVTVTCPGLPYSGLLYEVQHRTPYDGGWQSRVAELCNVTIEGLDLGHCHSFRARVLTQASSYGSEASPSDWSPVTHWQGAAPRDSCLQWPPLPKWPRFFLVCSLVSLLTVALLLLAVCKAQRVKRVLMPSVPDPKGSFPGLFEHHQGDFQTAEERNAWEMFCHAPPCCHGPCGRTDGRTDGSHVMLRCTRQPSRKNGAAPRENEWITDTQDVAPWKKPPSGEQDPGSEQTLEVHVSRVDAELPLVTRPLSPHTREEEASVGSAQHPPRDPQGGTVVSLAGFTFMMTDNAYMKL
ncbi:cytokine receptor-like factor 2 isoform X1 [Heterocephalus glaber]|uniref:Cytokine receptor-like factor 2 n=1 Tax=Heterocephalus glaber TaxID=10181 RepID=A0AAX6Q5E3_HETGA|nr:cytokine receptor-like factor 2 isoform X1 [Heterocephalus glaber]